jgi:hypothetical protein
MRFYRTRRGFLALGVALLGGCATDPNLVSAANAPPDLARSGKAYVIIDVHERLGGIFGDARGDNGSQFINIAATPNPFYARTPASMKLGTGPRQRNKIVAIDPGTYRLSSLALGQNPCFFGLDDSPVEFTVAAGDVVYLGSLQYESFSATNPLNPFKTPRFHVTFAVNDELDAHREDLAKSLALLPGNPTIQTRLLTIRKPEVLVSSTKENWLDTSTPKDDWAPQTPPAPTPAPPVAPPPDSAGPWHEAPAP